MVVPLVEGWDSVAEVSVPLVMGGRANLLDLSRDIDDPLVFDVRLRLLGRKQLPRCLQTFSSLFHLVGTLGNVLDLFAFC